MEFKEVYEVKDVKLSLMESNPPKLRIDADGLARSTGYTDPKLSMAVYKRQPDDGIQDFTFVAKPPTGIVLPVLTPITADPYTMHDIPKWLKGVRVHAEKNAIEARLEDHGGGFTIEDLPTRGLVSESVPFTTIIKSSHGGPDESKQIEIVSEKEYKDFFKGNPPPIPKVDFNKEQVLAVSMGTKPTSGFSVEIVNIIHMTGGITGGFTFVHYVERSPTGPVLEVLTHPFHVVKCRQLVGGPTIFVKAN